MINFNRIIQCAPAGLGLTIEPERNRITLINSTIDNVNIHMTWHTVTMPGDQPFAELSIGQAIEENASCMPFDPRTTEKDILAFIEACFERYGFSGRRATLTAFIWLIWGECQRSSALTWSQSKAAAASVRYMVSNLDEAEVDMLADNTYGLLTDETRLLQLEQQLEQQATVTNITFTPSQADLDFIECMHTVSNPFSPLLRWLAEALFTATAGQTETLSFPNSLRPMLRRSVSAFGDDSGVLGHLNEIINQ